MGGSGFVGRNILTGLDADEKAYFSRKNSKFLDEKDIKYIPGDIRKPEDVENAIKNYDVIVHAIDVLNENEEKHEDVAVNGVKNIVNAIKKNSSGQKLIYFSAINAEKGDTSYFRSKRLAEVNAELLKNSLIVRPSIIFGPGDAFTRMLISAARMNPPFLPRSGNMNPVYIGDLITVLKNMLDFSGTINICSRENMHFADMFNIIRQKLGMKPVREISPRFFSLAIGRLEKRGIMTRDQLEMLKLDYYRENTSLYRFVREPVKYRDFIENSDLENF
ncbi:NADH dehydrogenase [Picrophilus oshimae DSM 9789]|nr:NADH dehydrogenase [Picrophilus oshimae DSM 9789]